MCQFAICISDDTFISLCMLGLPVYRKYCQDQGKRWLACSGDEAHTLWCVLSLQWRGSSNKVQKEKTAQEKGHCFPHECVSVCVSVCVLGASFVLRPCLLPPSPPSFLVGVVALNTNAYSSLIKPRLICVLRPECLYRCRNLNCQRYIVLNYTWGR